VKPTATVRKDTPADRLRSQRGTDVDWERLRQEFPLLDRCIYFNACSLGPLPRAGMQALREYGRVWDRNGTVVWFTEWMPLLERLRSLVGQLLHAPSGTIALAPSASVALMIMASSLLRRTTRRKVLIGELDFPTVGHQFLSRPDVTVEFVKSEDGVGVSPQAFAVRIDQDTALVATTHLTYATGCLQDVRSLVQVAHEKGAMVLVDGYHTVGCLPIDVGDLGCDVFVGGSLKWLSGGPGTAFIYCRPELIPELQPVGTGWLGTKDFLTFSLQELQYAEDARRFEGGTWAMPSHFVAAAALQLILDVGVDRISERLRDFTGRILDRCQAEGIATSTPVERERRCGIVSLHCERPEIVERALREDGVIVDSRPGLLRLSPHWALRPQELDRGLDLVVNRMAMARA